MGSGLLPQEAARDAIHIAVTSVHGIDILLTWNCRHIANAAIMKEFRTIVAGCSLSSSPTNPLILTAWQWTALCAAKAVVVHGWMIKPTFRPRKI